MIPKAIVTAVAAVLVSAPALGQQVEHEKHHPSESPAAAVPAPGGAASDPAAARPGMKACAMMAGGMMGRRMMGPGMMGQDMMAGRMMSPGAMGHGMGPEAMLEGLGLTVEQQAKARKVHDDLRDRHWEIMGRMMKEGRSMRDLLAAPTMDRPALEAAHRRMSALREQMFMAQLDARAQLESILAPEQRAALRQRMRGGGGMMMH